MRTCLEYVDEGTQTYLASYFGRSDRFALLQLTQQALAREPRYLIWDPTHVMLMPVKTLSLADSPPTTQAIYHHLGNALSSGTLHYFIVIRANKHAYFNRIKSAFTELGVEQYLIFIKSIDHALAIIQDCEKSPQD